ncbi:MAG: hypothetical protein HY335_00550, partial [Deinococcus sp.]|nr:hypothetical protein [Deinococcus sp.]
MRSTWTLLTLLALTLGIAGAQEMTQPEPAIPPVGTDLTVYFGDLALVRQIFDVELGEGISELPIPDLPQEVIEDSVHLSAVDQGAFNILESGFDAGQPPTVVSAQALLNAYIGQPVILVRDGVRQSITLLDITGLPLAGPAFLVEGEVVLPLRGVENDSLILPNPPVELLTITPGTPPSFKFLVQNSGATTRRLQLIYLTRSLSWSADYFLTVDPNNLADLAARVQLSNSTSHSFDNVNLALIAGNPSQAGLEQDVFFAAGLLARAARAEAAAPPSFIQEAIGEFFLFVLDRPISIAAGETKRLTLLEASGITAARRFEAFPA